MFCPGEHDVDDAAGEVVWCVRVEEDAADSAEAVGGDRTCRGFLAGLSFYLFSGQSNLVCCAYRHDSPHGLPPHRVSQFRPALI